MIFINSLNLFLGVVLKKRVALKFPEIPSKYLMRLLGTHAWLHVCLSLGIQSILPCEVKGKLN